MMRIDLPAPAMASQMCTVSNKDRNTFQSWLEGFEDWEKAAYERAMSEDPLIYFVDIENVGGLVTPLPMTITYEDGSVREHMIPAEIWRRNAEQVTHYFFETRPIASISIDDKHQTADADYGNNRFPPQIERSRFEIYKSSSSRRNLMKDMMVELKGDDKTTEDSNDVPLQQQ